MSGRGLGMIFASAVITVAANLLLRAGVRGAGGLDFTGGKLISQASALLRHPSFLLGVLFYGLAAVVWFGVISVEDLSTSYPLLVSMTFVLVTIGAVLLFGERLPLQKIIGIAVILAGVVLVARA